MTHFVMDFNSYTIVFIIAVIWVILTAILQQIFPSYSKKEHRELWERYHPNKPIPEKYKFVPNDPYENKKIINKIGLLLSLLILIGLVILAVEFTGFSGIKSVIFRY